MSDPNSIPQTREEALLRAKELVGFIEKQHWIMIQFRIAQLEAWIKLEEIKQQAESLSRMMKEP